MTSLTIKATAGPTASKSVRNTLYLHYLVKKPGKSLTSSQLGPGGLMTKMNILMPELNKIVGEQLQAITNIAVLKTTAISVCRAQLLFI